MPTVRLHTRDPLRIFNFHVYALDATGKPRALAGVQRVSGLTATVGVYETWEGGNNLHRFANPDKVTWDPITLEQGLALDDALERWANAVLTWARTGKATPGEPVKRYLRIDLPDPATPRVPAATGKSLDANADAFAAEVAKSRTAGASTPKTNPVRSYLVKNAWITKFNALPRLDALSQEVGLVTVEIAHEGWVLSASPTS